jgi:hypothetical protein
VVNQWSNYIKLQFWFVFTSPIFYNSTIIRSRHGESPASFAETQVDEGFPETALPTQGTDSRWETGEKSPTSGTGSMELGRIFQSLLPSGNLLHSYWTWPIYSGFTYEKWWFSIVMLVYRSLLCFFFPGKHGKPHWKNAMNFPVNASDFFHEIVICWRLNPLGITGKKGKIYS